MHKPDSKGWTEGTIAEHLDRMQAAPARLLGALAISYDWNQHPEPVLGWAMAQKSIPLATAVTVFFNGRPERYNYLHKRNVPASGRAEARLLDNICQRINSGFYLADGPRSLAAEPRLRNWLEVQQRDRAAHSAGRWVLNEDILGAMCRPV